MQRRDTTWASAVSLACLLALACVVGCTPPPPAPTPEPFAGVKAAEAPLAAAVAWLWQQQRDDGSWRSQYGLMRSGQSLTPFVLDALLDVPESIAPRPADGFERALAFLREHINDQGVLGRQDSLILDYPNYATAYALKCLVRAGRPEDAKQIATMRAYLLAEQFNEDRGIGPDHPAYGGWGFGEELASGQVGHVDLAHTRRVLEALAATGEVPSPVLARSGGFLERLQSLPATPGGEATRRRADGGFHFSPVVPVANKASRPDQPGHPSYATATCDGLLAWFAHGPAADLDATERALRWLENRPDFGFPAGVPRDSHEGWGDALHFYHLAVRGEVARRLPSRTRQRWGEALLAVLTEQQHDDGSFRNAVNSLQKEDDPLLATTHAVRALRAAVAD